MLVREELRASTVFETSSGLPSARALDGGKRTGLHQLRSILEMWKARNVAVLQKISLKSIVVYSYCLCVHHGEND